MKQMLLSLIKAEKLVSLKRSMTENSKNACWLLFSVILLTGMVTGVAGPLENRVRLMTEQTSFMRKETALYRAFAENQDYAQKQARQRDLLEMLQEQIPEKIEPEEEVQKIYRLAGLHSIKVQRCKQVSLSSADSDKTGNRVNRFLWETEFSGTWHDSWHDLLSFFNDIETRGPCTRIETLQIRKSAEKVKGNAVSETVRHAELDVSGRVCVYYSAK